jgi:peptidoglycan-associated lipoprotein
MVRHLAKALLIGLVLVVAGCSGMRDEANNGVGQNATPGSEQDFQLNIGSKVFFETDSSELTAEGRATLERQAAWLKIYPQYGLINLEGHADERGTREYNLSLGARRANAARNYLISQGVPADRMKVISFGKERPVAVCNDISCWSQNRRVETLLQGR